MDQLQRFWPGYLPVVAVVEQIDNNSLMFNGDFLQRVLEVSYNFAIVPSGQI